jgi:hypothetical protein
MFTYGYLWLLRDIYGNLWLEMKAVNKYLTFLRDPLSQLLQNKDVTTE